MLTIEEKRKICKRCKYHVLDENKDIICELINKAAEFEESCNLYEVNIDAKSEPEFKTAGQGKRLTNYLLDLAFLYVFALTFGFILGIFLLFVSPDTLLSITEDNMFTEYLLGFIAGMLYFTTLEALTGRTIAKYITKTKVVTITGEKPDFKTIFLRSLCRFIPFEAFSFLGSDNSGWHDKFTKTKVVVIENNSY